jgi:hypothetical protein
VRGRGREEGEEEKREKGRGEERTSEKEGDGGRESEGWSGTVWERSRMMERGEEGEGKGEGKG